MHHETVEIENTDECIERLKVILKNGQNTNPVCQCRNLHFPAGNITDFKSIWLGCYSQNLDVNFISLLRILYFLVMCKVCSIIRE